MHITRGKEPFTWSFAFTPTYVFMLLLASSYRLAKSVTA
jgi:hypothetical protein